MTRSKPIRAEAGAPSQREVARAVPRVSLDSPGKPRKPASQVGSREMVEAILEAATQLIEEGGLKAASTTAVAERAGVSIGSFYQYFGSQEDLFGELVRRHGLTLHPILRKARRAPSRAWRVSCGGPSGPDPRPRGSPRGRPTLMAALEREFTDVHPSETAQWRAELPTQISQFLAGCLAGDPESRMANA